MQHKNDLPFLRQADRKLLEKLSAGLAQRNALNRNLSHTYRSSDIWARGSEDPGRGNTAAQFGGH